MIGSSYSHMGNVQALHVYTAALWIVVLICAVPWAANIALALLSKLLDRNPVGMVL